MNNPQRAADIPPGKTTVPARTDQWHDQILCGDAYEQLCQLPDDLVDTIVTSPPYYRQRDYQGSQQIGQEATVQTYVDRLATVFQECRRVLKPSGSLWLVLGDKYLDGCQLGMPWRVALALQEEGWILRSDIIWHKPNAMPSSVKTRPTT
ncbi:MAG: site-specific DNA-methyltransferase, partial [Pirellulaceae bacterium]|nr:site-specific DNA-methyltransferase [Pirellulaceae bacterium]